MKLLLRLLRIVLAVVGLFVVVLLAAELWASTTEAGNAAYFIEDPVLGIVRKPDLQGYTAGQGRWIPIHISKEGLRGDDLPAVRDPSEEWILCVGDSFTFGGGLDTEDGFPQQMQGLVGPPEKSGVRVLNGGANGWNTPWQRLYLESRALDQFHPKVVVLGWNWNDLHAEPNAPAGAVEIFLKVKDSPILSLFGDWPSARATHLYRWLYARENRSGTIPGDEQLKRAYANYKQKRDRQALAPERKIAEIRKRRYGNRPPDMDFWLATDTPDWTLVRSEFARIAEDCRQHDAKLLVALLAEPTWEGPGTYPPVDRMTALLDDIGVPWVDTQPDFLDRDAAGRPHGKKDLWQRYDPVHPTAEGQAIFARLIVDKLRELGWIPGP